MPTEQELTQMGFIVVKLNRWRLAEWLPVVRIRDMYPPYAPKWYARPIYARQLVWHVQHLLDYLAFGKHEGWSLYSTRWQNTDSIQYFNLHE